LVDGGDLRMHHFRADLHVADRVVAVRRRVAFPDRHAMRHELAHRRLEVVVAHDTAGDTRRAGADAGLVEHDDAGAAWTDGHAARGELLREMHGGRQAVNAGADHRVLRVGWKDGHESQSVEVSNSSRSASHAASEGSAATSVSMRDARGAPRT